MSKEGLLGIGTGTGTGTGETEEGCETCMSDMEGDINTFFGESSLNVFRGRAPSPELLDFLEIRNPQKRPRLSSSWSEGVGSLQGDEAMQAGQAVEVSAVAANCPTEA